MLRVALFFSVIGFAAFAHANTDACLTWEGVWVAPWTDGYDPACGDGCEAEAEPAGDTLCSSPDEDCSDLADADGGALRMPAPAPEDRNGPRCLRPGPECSPGGGSGTGYALGGALVLVPSTPKTPTRAPGTLPGAPRPHTRHVAWDRAITPPTPPPRA